MDHSEPSRSQTWLLTAALLLLLAGYAGAYFALVLPSGEVRGTTFIPHYQAGGAMAEVLFHPAFSLDVQIRREHWKTIMEPEPILVETLDVSFDIDTDIPFVVNP